MKNKIITRKKGTTPEHSRLAQNLKILRDIKAYVLMNPDQRFGQILSNLGVIEEEVVEDVTKRGENKRIYTTLWKNHFYEEPIEMLRRIKQSKKEK